MLVLLLLNYGQLRYLVGGFALSLTDRLMLFFFELDFRTKLDLVRYMFCRGHYNRFNG